MQIAKQVKQVGQAATERGWRHAVAERVVPAVAERTRARPDQVRMVLGLVLLALSVKFLIGTLSRAHRAA